MKDGGPAFPNEQHETQEGSWNQTFNPGMSKRELFAGMIAAGIVSNPQLADINGAAFAVEFADALLKKLEATESST